MRTLSGTLAWGGARRSIDWAGIGLPGHGLDWQQRAACRDVADPDVFFPEPGQAGRRAATEARQMCARCPVADACRAYAAAHDEHFGIWGGQSENQRRTTLTRTRRPWARHRDAEVARLTRAGLTADQIAHRLDITPRTVSRARARSRAGEGVAA
jgi:hypothetical protein